MDYFQIEENYRKIENNYDTQLRVLAFSSFVNAMGFCYVLPFFPVMAHQNAGLDYTLIGILMSINSVGSSIFSFIFGSRMQIWGRKMFLIIALILQANLMFAYGLLYFTTSSYWLFLFLSISIRITEGVSKSTNQILNYAYINLFWKESFAQNFSIIDTLSSLGAIMGPVLGSILNYFFGYYIPLMGLGLLFLFNAFLNWCFIPPDSGLKFETKEKAKLPLCKVLSKKRVLITFMTLVITRGSLNYYNSFFAHHMASFGVDENLSALVFCIPQFAYIFTVSVIPLMFKTQDHFEFLQQMSIIICFFSTAIISPFWFLEGNAHHFFVGQLLMGIGSALNRLPAIPVLSKGLKQTLGSKENDQSLNDMASALFQINQSISNLIFPFMGGFLYDHFDGQSEDPIIEMTAFRNTMLVYTIFQVAQFSLDLIINERWKVWFHTFSEQNKQNRLLVFNSRDLNDAETSDSISQYGK